MADAAAPRLGCLIMAAGNASRFGANKLFAAYRGKTFLELALLAVPPQLFARVMVVSQYEPALGLARQYGFMILADECYSEIYTWAAPGSMLEAAGPDFANVVVFQSLSKRSNLPGMRVGFVAGDPKFLAAFHELRNVAAPQVPVPLQYVAAAAYNDEAHVEENRRLYRLKFDLAD